MIEMFLQNIHFYYSININSQEVRAVANVLIIM